MILIKSAAGFLNRVEQRFLMREVTKERHDIGERFVKCGDVRTRPFREVSANTVEDRVREFMHDDVVRQTSEHCLTGQIASGIYSTGAKISKQDSLCRRRISCIR